MSGNLSASILARLLTLAKQRGDDYSLLLNRFALERLLLRVGTSPHANRFLLKGALLFALWYDEPHRPTRDADLLGFGPDDEANLIATFRDIAAMNLGDGIEFDPGSVNANAIREDNTYGGTRITLMARIGSARCALQIDIGFGDAVTPEPQTVAYPTLLKDFQAPTLRVYPVYTVIAEKYHAMVVLGQANSRMKDFYDLAVIARRTELDGATLAAAMVATFSRRQTPLPSEHPLALTSQFSEDPAKLKQWQAFLNKNRITAGSLAETVALLNLLLWRPTEVAVAQSQVTTTWHPASAQWAMSPRL
ncbi:MAG: nucleotidyl transferase AbiEii/AbiGii toxin family protein [Hydrogenophaga sp.]|uniref:nucleotidyl transferase AbiEii/AbiGii toxin family protein n=1 Tax=Hydrogenophaga sp. TaxID=1904254 RepID=UPI00274AFB55|nr:nucleotidyl transferase AbiEii/AbiGii toxin family protein [Hydrogenophaga sp.]MDP2418827.1 nucleotidyl transferase AbiEii/AbiGii toxin family protein [Hydrogenophaga sp.]MDZ4189849.1 nucleotidyl transferase AbiEii/AbiGii toxin family protein [Hydrogenophaga sp.]